MNGYIGDGLPDTGRYSMDGNGVRTMPSDTSMFCVFYKRATHNPLKSTQAGRPIYEDVDFVRIQQPGERSTVVEREVKDSDKRRWPAQWHAYAQNKDQVAEGTPLGLLFPNHPAHVANLQALGFTTVEQLAAASATAIDNIGMHGQDYVNYAQKYIAGASGGSGFHKVQEELTLTKRQNARLQQQLDDLQQQMQSMQAAMTQQAFGAFQQPTQPVAQPYVPQPLSAPPIPTFKGSAVIDAQSEQIAANHPSNDVPSKRKRARIG